MATLEVDGDQLAVRTSKVERFEAFHPDVDVPLTAVRDVRVVDDPWTERRGIRAPGTGPPGVIGAGTPRAALPRR